MHIGFFKLQIAVFLLVGGYFFAVKSAFAELPTQVLSNNQAALKKVQSKIVNVDENLEQLQHQQQQIRLQIAELDQKLVKITTSIEDYDLQIAENLKLIRNTEVSIRQQTQHINTQRQNLSQQIKAAYAMGQHDRLKLLLNQQDPALSSRMLGYFDALNKMRLSKMSQLSSNIELLQQLEHEHAVENQNLHALQQSKHMEQESLAKLKQQRTVLLAQIKTDILADQKQLQDLRSDAQALQTLIAKLQVSADRESISPSENTNSKRALNTQAEPSHTPEKLPRQSDVKEEHISASAQKVNSEFTSASNQMVQFASLKGRLPWPVSGNVVLPFGSSRLDSHLQGILIGASVGQPVKAVAEGKIAYSGWLRGYGMLTIINHGNGYMSVYAFNQSLHKHAGEHVKPGEIIARVGQGLGQVQAGLYFEIRKQGAPLNPDTWCKK